MYSIGLLSQPPATLVTCLAFFYLSYRHYHQLPLTWGKPLPSNALAEWKLYLAGGLAVLSGIWPIVTTEPTSKRIMKIADEEDRQTTIGEKGLWTEGKPAASSSQQEEGEDAAGAVKSLADEDEMPTLLKHWATLNVARAAFPLIGTGIALYAILA